MYTVTEKHGPLATPWGTWIPGEPFSGDSVPKDKLLAWKKAGIVIVDDKGPDVEEILEERDFLSSMTRKELLAIIVQHKLNLLPDGLAVKPKTSWPDEAVRQAIRDSVDDLTSLQKPPAAILESVL